MIKKEHILYVFFFSYNLKNTREIKVIKLIYLYKKSKNVVRYRKLIYN